MKVIPISKELHRSWSYTGLSHYIHAQKDPLVPILVAEIGRLISTNPIMFIEDQEKIGVYSMQSLFPDSNLMINKQGLWTSDYIPARYRSLPFVLASDSKDKTGDEKILCYIEDFGCVAETFDQESTQIFNKKGELSEDMQKVFEFLQSIEQNEIITQKALNSIKTANVLKDWTLSLKLTDGEKKMTGLRVVDMDKLKDLEGTVLEELNKTGGLDICFASHLSLNNLERLKQLAIDKASEAKDDKKMESAKTIRDLTIEKQKKAQKEEMDTLVKDLLLDD